MGRSGVTILAALAMLAAACSDPAALASTDDVAPLGPTVTLAGDAGDRSVPAPSLQPSPSTTLPTTPPLPSLPPTLPPPEPVTVLAAGNLGACNAHSTEVAEAVAADEGVIIAAGDLSPDGSAEKLQECFLVALDTDLDRLLAVPGDRDLQTDDGAAFFSLLGETLTPTDNDGGWFVTTLGGWQIIGLNSNCDAAGGCEPGSAQYEWLDDVLREQPAECRAVVWHGARFTSAEGETPATEMGPMLGRLDGAGADLLITGSPGNFERFAPLRPDGRRVDEGEAGIRHFNIGGGSGAGFNRDIASGSVTRKDAFNGYVRFVLAPEGYTWEFVATSEGSSTPDIGSASC